MIKYLQIKVQPGLQANFPWDFIGDWQIRLSQSTLNLRQSVLINKSRKMNIQSFLGKSTIQLTDYKGPQNDLVDVLGYLYGLRLGISKYNFGNILMAGLYLQVDQLLEQLEQVLQVWQNDLQLEQILIILNGHSDSPKRMKLICYQGLSKNMKRLKNISILQKLSDQEVICLSKHSTNSPILISNILRLKFPDNQFLIKQLFPPQKIDKFQFFIIHQLPYLRQSQLDSNTWMALKEVLALLTVQIEFKKDKITQLKDQQSIQLLLKSIDV